MQLMIYIGIIQSALVLLMSMISLIAILHPKTMTSATVSTTVLLPLGSLFMTWAQRGFCRAVPDMWWFSIFFLFINWLVGLGSWIILTGTLVAKDDCIYRIPWYILPRKYTWADVDHYYSGWDQYRRKRRVSKNFEIEICFADGAESTIFFKEDTTPKAVCLLNLLRTHRCKRKK